MKRYKPPTELGQILRAAPVIPVLTIRRMEHAVPLAEALVAGGLRVLEVTLRTDIAARAIRAIRDAVPDAIAGAGTILGAHDLEVSRESGAQFGVSPGLSVELSSAVIADGLPFLPGVATASEAMQAREQGFRHLKFFPAEAMGGRSTLGGFAAPFRDLLFCPTGGIREDTMDSYLALPNVVCVGGSWMVRDEHLERGDWAAVTELAQRITRARSAPA